jgi:hypothetical protein
MSASECLCRQWPRSFGCSQSSCRFGCNAAPRLRVMPEVIGEVLTGRLASLSTAITAENIASAISMLPPSLTILLHNASLQWLFNAGLDAPARCRDCLFKAKAANDLLENRVALRLRCELRGNFDASTFLQIGALKTPQA